MEQGYASIEGDIFDGLSSESLFKIFDMASFTAVAILYNQLNCCLKAWRNSIDWYVAQTMEIKPELPIEFKDNIYYTQCT